MIYLKKIINQDLVRTPTFNVESIRDFFKIDLENGNSIIKKITLIPESKVFEVTFQKRNTRDEYRVFLKDLFLEINPSEEDILIFRKQNQDIFSCEHIGVDHNSYIHFNHLFEESKNHQLIIDEAEMSKNEGLLTHQNILEDFISWFIKYNGVKHNYFTDFFSGNREKLKQELIKYEEIYEKEFSSKLFMQNTQNIEEFIVSTKTNLDKKYGDFFEYSLRRSNHMPRAILGKNNYIAFLREKFIQRIVIPQSEFDVNKFILSCKDSGLIYNNKFIVRFVASLLTKPFVILTGLSGSGKTKLAQAFVQWICQNEKQYRIIPVGADWTNREPLLGYPNALKPDEYVKPDSGVLDLVIQANNNKDLPHFLILDEMNLSHVERYFADFLSVMESKKEIPLYAEGTVNNGVPASLKLPANLFIIGTVNIDETTNMFSPKVLDRANTIEFRVSQDEMNTFLGNIKEIKMEALDTKGAGIAENFLEMSSNHSFATTDLVLINDTLIQFFGELKKTGAEFGYRSASEILRLIHQLSTLDNKLSTSEKIDIAIMQKLLPKLHGSRRKLCPVLETLGGFCLRDTTNIIKDVFEKDNFDYSQSKYPLSLEKIARMYKGAIDNGFASFAEA